MATPKSSAKPTTISEILQATLSKHGLGRDFNKWRIFALWEKSVGPTIAKSTEPLRLQAGTLTIAVTSSTWMQELQFMKQEILDRLNREIEMLDGPPTTTSQRSLSHSPIRSLKFVLGKKTAALRRDPVVQPSIVMPISSEQIQEADKMTQSIGDEELRQAFKDLFLKTRSRKRR